MEYIAILGAHAERGACALSGSITLRATSRTRPGFSHPIRIVPNVGLEDDSPSSKSGGSPEEEQDCASEGGSSAAAGGPHAMSYQGPSQPPTPGQRGAT
ncbi:hypothetical protein EVAR_73426_1 [Eumeta japonica]|uniref:Uncharacterized protein n=1 Tax=Eumeta variegata TaxID=151549 RepID=A0A4C1TI22_EUMVA|nr:hypothetical protein EVAR_73426_1 [Eumeta japonica]